jgi:hypothetical protein
MLVLKEMNSRPSQKILKFKKHSLSLFLQEWKHILGLSEESLESDF